MSDRYQGPNHARANPLTLDNVKAEVDRISAVAGTIGSVDLEVRARRVEADLATLARAQERPPTRQWWARRSYFRRALGTRTIARERGELPLEPYCTHCLHRRSWHFGRHAARRGFRCPIARSGLF